MEQTGWQKYENKEGLLNSPIPNQPENTGENTVLFTLAFFFRYFSITGKKPPEVFESIMDFIYRLRVEKEGVWYHNLLPGERVGNEEDKFTSRDQMIAYSIVSVIEGSRKEAKEIWRGIWKNIFTYDNVSKKINFKRIVRPRDWIYIGYLAKNPICWMLMPWYYINQLITCFRSGPKHTSGVQLFWQQCYADTHPLSKLVLPLCDKILKSKFETEHWLDEVLSIYYPQDHPVNELLANNKKGDLA